MDVLLREGLTLSKDLKRLAGFGGDGLKGFDTVMTSLQIYFNSLHNSSPFWEDVRQDVCALLVRFCHNVGINVRCRADLSMAQPL